MTPAPSRRFWETRAAALAWRINLGAWLGAVAPASFFFASGFAVLFYALRRLGWPLAPGWWALGATWLVLAAACLGGVRRTFFSSADAAVLLEAHLRMDNRLTAAQAGLVAWPAIPAGASKVLRWQLRGVVGWFVGAVVMLWAALAAPVPRESSAVARGGPPPSLALAEAMLRALQEQKLADPRALEPLAERARELARRPSDEQYGHSALEAADALRDQTAAATSALARGLDAAAAALRSADHGVDMKSAAGRLAAALSGLKDGALPANKELLNHLPSGETDLKNLTPEEREQLAQALAQAGAQAGGIAGAAGAGASVAQPDPSAQGRGEQPGFGAGGEGGGGESAPLTLANQMSDAGDGLARGLDGNALRRFSLGDKLGTTVGQHDKDPARLVAPTAAGAVAAPAAGGEAVWVDRLTPAERAALKNFFK